MNSRKSPQKSVDKPKNSSNFLKALALAIFAALLLFIIFYCLVDAIDLDVMHHNPNFDFYYLRIATGLSILNILLLIYLLAKYIEVLLEVPSDFTLGLVFVITVLLFYSYSANPMFYTNFGFLPMIGPFVFLPLLFTTFASLALIYIASR